jgi:predicted ester cyclase
MGMSTGTRHASESGRSIVERHIEEVLNGTNLDACDELFAEDYVEHAHAPFATEPPGLVHGPTSARETARWLRAQFPDFEVTIRAIVAEDDLVVVRVLSQGTNLGALGGAAPPTRKRFSAEQSHWYRVQDGKLCEHWATRDDLTTMLQLGVVDRPGPPALVRSLRRLAGALRINSSD